MGSQEENIDISVTTEINEKSKDYEESDFLLKDRIEGALYGAYIADSIGSAVEFSKSLSKKEIESAMEMNGSPIFNTAPGQITDDSELSLALGLALDSNKLDLNKIAYNYVEWAGSDPFDIGNTLGHSMRTAAKVKDKENKAKAMYLAALDKKDSRSNGSLMKLMPLCIWARKLSGDDLWTAITKECSLTHHNRYNHYINYAYSYLTQSILNMGKYVNKTSLLNLRGFLYEKLKSHILNKIEDEEDEEIKKEVKEWFTIAESKNPKEFLDKFPMGYVKIAFCLTLHFFIKDYEKEPNYKAIIAEVLSYAGDTDTNAAIVGGLIGCYLGKKKLPEAYIKKIDNCDTRNGGQYRPYYYTPKYVLKTVIENITKNASDTLEYYPKL